MIYYRSQIMIPLELNPEFVQWESGSIHSLMEFSKNQKIELPDIFRFIKLLWAPKMVLNLPDHK